MRRGSMARGSSADLWLIFGWIPGWIFGGSSAELLLELLLDLLLDCLLDILLADLLLDLLLADRWPDRCSLTGCWPTCQAVQSARSSS